MEHGGRRGPLVAVLVIGIGLVVAPVVFQMFSRAPEGGDMINDFRPYMTTEKIESFQGYLQVVGDADVESQEELRPAAIESGAVDEAGYETQFPLVAEFNDEWPGIDEDMTDLLDTMAANIGNFEAVDALPSFDLFPWFFVIPGVLTAGLAGWALWRERSGANARPVLWALGVVGVAVALAPVAFQMFSRAPQGNDMIDAFGPVMTQERVENVQGYFVTMGTAEGQLRTGVVPLVTETTGVSPEEAVAEYPATDQFFLEWPTIVGDFAPMVAAMSDNVDNFAAVDALPPFALFPWFFLIPGLLIAVLAAVALRRRPGETGTALPQASGSAEPTAEASLQESATSRREQ